MMRKRLFRAMLGLGAVSLAGASALVAPPVLAAPAPVFGSCPEGAVTPGAGAQCAVVSVPMDHAEPGGARIELTVSRIAARGERRGVLFTNPGGPGVDALDFWAQRVATMPADIAAHYDLYAVQPRGLRWATPLSCAVETTEDGQVALSDADLRAACEQDRPGYLATITTENTARDLDAVRAALGLERIGYLGTSYGTYLGAVYATLFPQRVERMVLDSNVHPGWVWTEEFAQQQAAGKQRLDDLFSWIAERDAEYHLGDTSMQVYRTWVRQVSAQGGGWYANITPPPAHVSDLPGELPEPLAEIARDGVNGGTEQLAKVQNFLRLLLSGGASAQVPLVSATSVATYTRAFWPAFAEAMARAQADPSDVEQLVAIAGATKTDPAGRIVFSAITCNENAVPGRPEMLGAAVSTLASGGNALDARAALVRSGMSCGSWPPVTEPVTIDGSALATAPLLLQSEHDALTQYEGGPALAKALHGSLITVEGGDHGTFGRGNPVVDEAVLTYLRTGEVHISEAPEAPLPAA
ncbi:alpha/beta hydrolase [Nocardia higoensis]|uniref:alpha/beta hydrolase n=1 Tax=Nocardia higoensis TaxID=228599 RepID=UPI000305EC5D|nr:alpha/beta hydrolase [Nocardia higoensis]